MTRSPKQPVIILGMHRSGTSLLAQCLERLGLFIGVKKNFSSEALFFLRLNEWMLVQGHARWDNVHCLKFADDFYRGHMVRVAKMHLTGPKRAEFLGHWKALRYRDIRDLDIHWGWKDPRNTFTIDVWNAIFPNAKVLHIFRNPLDVVASLKNREDRKTFTLTKKIRKNEQKLKGFVEYIHSMRVRDPREGIALWEDYVTKAFSLDGKLGGRILHIKYEDLLMRHDEIFSDIVSFIGMHCTAADIASLRSNIRGDRKFTFQANDSLVELYREIQSSDLMVRLGYNSLI